MSVAAIILLILLGIALLLIEFLVVPGVTIAGVLGTLLIIGGVFCGYYFHQTPTGHYILLGSVGVMSAIFVTAFKTKTWRRMGLQTSIEGKVGVIEEEEIHVDDTGKTTSRLNPIGKALINNQLFEVRSNGSYIDSNKEIKVIRIDGNKIYVELKSN